MEFGIRPELEDLLGRLRGFVRDELIPLEPDLLDQRFDHLWPALATARQRAKERGWWAPFLTRELGGMGLSLLDFAHVSEELGRCAVGHYAFNCQAPDVGNMEILHRFGTDEQRESYLLPLARGEIRSCFSMTEPDRAGSNPVWMDTTAVIDGDDYVINGRKWFTTAADGAAFAIVMAVTNPEADSRHLRASQIIVPTDNPGFQLLRNLSIMGEEGDAHASHAEVDYVDCRVPRTNLLGDEGAGFVIAQERLGPGRIHHCMRWVGICERAFDLMCQRAAEREVAPDRPLGTRQIVQAWIAESRAEINAARLMVLQAAWKIDAQGARAARDEISAIKFYVAGVLHRVLDRALQTHGGLGMTDQTPLAYWYRHERAARIYDGPDEVHKVSMARRILRGYGVSVGSPPGSGRPEDSRPSDSRRRT